MKTFAPIVARERLIRAARPTGPSLRSRLAATISTFRSGITAPNAGEPFLPKLHGYPYRG